MRGAIHQITVLHYAAATPDSEGRGGEREVGPTIVRGRAAMLSGRELLGAAQYGEGLTAAAQLPLGSQVTAADRVLLEQIGAELDGLWEIGAVRNVGPHLRVLLRRARIGAE